MNYKKKIKYHTLIRMNLRPHAILLCLQPHAIDEKRRFFHTWVDKDLMGIRH
jgi:hypothetical protein